MKITLLVIGKTDARWLQEGMDIYLKRLKHYISFEITVIPEIKNARNFSVPLLKEKEGLQILSRIGSKDEGILLDERGRQLSSRELAEFLEKKMLSACRELIFVVGGAYGFSEEVENRASDKISLSRMTFSHQMVRLLFVEQLYRAFTIIRGESYHND